MGESLMLKGRFTGTRAEERLRKYRPVYVEHATRRSGPFAS